MTDDRHIQEWGCSIRLRDGKKIELHNDMQDEILATLERRSFDQLMGGKALGIGLKSTPRNRLRAWLAEKLIDLALRLDPTCLPW